MMLRSLHASLALAAGLALGACDDGDDDSDDGEAMASACKDDDGVDAFTTALAKTGEQYTLSIVDAEPATPERGDNSWTIEVTDASGAPVDGVTLDAKPWMPEHGHGTPVEELVTALGDGEYRIDSLNLFMRGLWVITLDVEDDEQVADEVVISVCIE